ncbi:hypothetical protein K3169_13260 [Pseudomonas phytophila]|uniref:Sel1 repeat family protein n=1 Tax=Pseudomonas phytophila TaxID=2867264 RepID=A0ABY6FLP9_9PSED|nr:hypothetical protein [Pseudomonas phytophila]UXZ98759.1 hypothetical protein K3169_13260 [Pseudomonas phytophila]
MKFLSVFTLVMVAILSGCDKKLEDFNHLPALYGSSDQLSVNKQLLAEFKDKNFVCRSETDFLPKESTAAAQAFRQLVEYASQGDQTENFWRDKEHKKKREDLLAVAIKEGSWKAKYLDSVWSLRYPASPEKAAAASDTINEFVQQGVPIVVAGYGASLYGRDYDAMYKLLSDAVDRGSPQAMASVGGNIVPQAKELHPVGKQMLECAVKQGYAPAYASLGQLAWMEGRRLDAYRLWEKGVNEGCADCSERLEYIGRVRPGYTYATPMLDLVPELAAINAFYEHNLFYELSGLRDFERPLPEALAFHLDDKELLKLLELEQRTQQ